MYAAFKAAAEAGVLVVAAGGNDGAAGAGTVQNNLPCELPRRSHARARGFGW